MHNLINDLPSDKKTYQSRTVLEEVTDTLVAGHGMVNWVLVLELISFFDLGNIRPNLLDHAVEEEKKIS